MAQAYRFFRKAALAYLVPTIGVEGVGPRAQRFAAALKDYLKLIVLDLDPSDEPQAIFETLNAHGTPLLPADLVKNWLLWEAARQGLDLTDLYERNWRRFDRDHEFWRTRTGAGHAARARVDGFLQAWLTKETGDAISPKHVYDRFLRLATGLRAASADGRVDVGGLMSAIAADADRYVTIDAAVGTDRLARFLQRLKPLDVTALDPVLLAMMGRGGTDVADLTDAAVAIESYLVRRMVCGYQTRSYGALALRLLKAIRETPDDAPVAPAISAELVASVGGADSWPDDEEFGRHWRQRNFYNGLRRSRTLMVLKALEEAYQAQFWKGEPILTFDLDRLQIEHVMPQSWHDHWPMVEDVSAEQRTWALNGVGNLTLVSERLNPSLSNGPWIGGTTGCKSEGLRRHSKLEMNRRLLEDHPSWTDGSIAQRADELFREARVIWPPADGAA